MLNRRSFSLLVLIGALLLFVMTMNTKKAESSELEDRVKKIVEDFGPRDYKHSLNLEQLARWLAEEFLKSRAKTELQSFQVDDKTYYNVSALYGDSTVPRIVVGAHYDTAGPLPGADDNASGVAALLELSGLLAKSRVNGAVELVAFTLEEAPFFSSEKMGSMVHAKSLKQKNIRTIAMISLEMIGYFSEQENSQQYPLRELYLTYPTKGDFIAIVGRRNEVGLVQTLAEGFRMNTSLPVHFYTGSEETIGLALSDHSSYWRHGMKAVMVTDTSFFRNKNYHTENDTPDTLDYSRMAETIKGLHSALLQLSRTEID